MKTIGFVDREAETRRLRQAILDRESLVICGCAGIGKSALIAKAIDELPKEVAARCIRLHGMKDLQDLLRQLVRAVYEAEDHNVRRKLHAQRVSPAAFGGWLKAASVSLLRGTLYEAVESGDYGIFLDHLPPVTRAAARAIKELFWMRKTPVYMVPYGLTEGAVDRLMRIFYWGDAQRLVLGPLPMPAARQLLECCIARFGLSKLELGVFQGEVLELSKRVPGAITTMCALAADPRYRSGNRIKTKTVYLDYLTKSQGVTASQAGRSHYQP